MAKYRDPGGGGGTRPAGHGSDEAADWLRALGLAPVPRWHVEVTLDAGAGTRFHLNVYAEEWGFAFHHARRSSWIRVTDVPFVHGRDDFNLILIAPDLTGLGAFLGSLEQTHSIDFGRTGATVRSNVPRAQAAVRRWLAQPSVGCDRERCDDEIHDGIRCTRPKGHEGHHAFDSDAGALRWKPST
jgi:hypothetical protein